MIEHEVGLDHQMGYSAQRNWLGYEISGYLSEVHDIYLKRVSRFRRGAIFLYRDFG